MREQDIYLFLREFVKDAEEEHIINTCYPLLYHIEARVRQELPHVTKDFDHDHLVLLPPYDDVYWTYSLAFMLLSLGERESYREVYKLFEQAWENFSKQAFLQKESLEIAPYYRENGETL